MAEPRMAHILLAALLLVAASVPMAWASKADVNIFNDVGETIVLHCKSGDTDLGEHHVAAGGKYGWGFSPNYLRNTLYWCSFGWRNQAPVFAVWTDEGVLQQRSRPCTHCEWRVRADGFYRNDAGKPPVRVHGWNSQLV